MTAEDLRTLLKGTGAEVVDCATPIVFVSKVEFRLANQYEVDQLYRGDWEDSNIVDVTMSVTVSTFQGTDEMIRMHFGGRNVFVYDSTDTIAGLRKLRHYVWEKS